MSLKCIVIEDEQHALDILIEYIEKMPDLDVFASYLSPLLALNQIKKEDNIDFIFLDIEMPEISGLDVAKSLRNKTKFLIFTTGHTSYALNAFDLNASQYLLKPITFTKFATTINLILKDIAGNQYFYPGKMSNLQFIKADNKNAYHYVDSTEISYVSAAKNYSVIYTANEQFVTYMGLNHVEASLASTDFIRINKSIIISKKMIRKIEGNTIILKNDKTFQLGEIYKPAFQQFLHANILKDSFKRGSIK